MATAALVWEDPDGLKLAELRPDAPATVGRSSEASITLRDGTVSRMHFRVGFGAGTYVLENLSQTNQTRLNGVPITAPVILPNGSTIEAGATRLGFHDLTSGDHFSGPICSHCGRENSATEKDCWFCGTSLVNASSTIRQGKLVACRVIPALGAPRDLFIGESLLLGPDGPGEAVGTEADPSVLNSERIDVLRTGPTYRGTPGFAALLVNETAPGDGQPVRSGDRLAIGSFRAIVAVR